MATGKEVRVQTHDLRVGCTLRHPINDLLGTMLLASGVSITKRIKEQLIKRNIHAVFLHPDDIAGATRAEQKSRNTVLARKVVRATTPAADIKTKVDTLAEVVSYATKNTGAAIRDKIQPLGSVPYDAEQRKRLVEQFGVVNLLLESMIGSALNSRKQDVSNLAAAATDYASELIQDSSQAIATSEELAQGPEINARSIRMAVLAMAIAIEMRYDAKNVQTIGQAGLLHDWGMFRLTERLRAPDTPFASTDWYQIMKHPRYSVELLEKVSGISDLTRLVCYQVHEVYDGSGYPSGRRGELIHIFARILSVADTYISLVSEIRGRPALVPYDAMAYLLHQVKYGKFDSHVVRALLYTLSLFPIGSRVRLKDGSQGIVLRSNGKNFMKPVVQKLGGGQGLRIDSPNEMSIVNLAESEEELLEPLLSPQSKRNAAGSRLDERSALG